MNKIMKLALLVMAAGLVLAGCASLEQKTTDSWLTTKWDKAEKSTVILYFDEDFEIYKVDGKENVNIYGQAAPIRGSGTIKAPKARLIIPAGERKLTIGYKQDFAGMGKVSNDRRYEVPFTFIAGRFYQLIASQNRDAPQNPKFLALDAAVEEMNNQNQARAGTQQTIQEANATNQALMARMNEIKAEMAKLDLTEDRYATNVEIIDITGGKKKNSPVYYVTTKSW